MREIVDEFLTLSDLLPLTVPYYLTFNLRAKTADKRSLSGLSVYPTAETRAGAVELYVGYDNLRELFSLDATAVAELTAALRATATRLDYNWAGWDKFLVDAPAQARAICGHIRALVAKPAPVQLST